MLNLVGAIREIEKTLREKKAQYEKEIEPYVQSLEYLNTLNEACLKCAGKGKVFHRACAEDEGSWVNCGECNGTGKKPKKKAKEKVKEIEQEMDGILIGSVSVYPPTAVLPCPKCGTVPYSVCRTSIPPKYTYGCCGIHTKCCDSPIEAVKEWNSLVKKEHLV